MEYKGYIGKVNYDSDMKIFHGDVINTRDVITFQGKSVNAIEKAFRDSINDYVSWCKEEGVNPEKPYSGKFNLRVSPALHRKIALSAYEQNTSLNKFIEEIVEKALG